MPIIKSAKKKLKQDKVRRGRNQAIAKTYKKTLKKVIKKSKMSVKDIALAYSKIDKAAKKRVIHKKKAARLKSRIAKRK